MSDLVGNKKVIKDFKEWLIDWNDVVINKNKKEIAFKKGQSF